MTTRRSIPLAVKQALWNREFGARAGEGCCACCGHAVTYQEVECGHVVSSRNGGTDSVDNIKPLCRTCNRSMGGENMDTFMCAYFTSQGP
jgi:5-methylcytosine-specific restriction endonuclease McrA